MKKALTKNQKIGIVVGIIALIGIGFGTYKLAKNYTNNKREEEQKKLDEQNKDTSDSSEETNVSSNLPASTDISKNCDPSKSPPSCNTVITTHDKNYNYVWCKDQWWTISKSSPASGGRVIICWTSLGGNATATEKLNAKYPNKS